MPIGRRGLLYVLALVLLSAACGSKAAETPATYQVRAQVTELAGEGEDARVSLHHEAIPGFKNREGEVVGMESMTMAFGIAPGVSRAALTPGAKLAVSFEVDWQREPSLLIERIEPLPPSTELKLR